LLGGSDVENVEVGGFGLSTGAAPTTQTITLDGSFRPDGLLFLSTQSTSASGSSQNDAHIGLGFSDFTKDYYLSATSDNGQTSGAVANCVLGEDSCIVRQAGDSQSIEGLANVRESASDGFVIDITNSFSSAYATLFIAIKGPSFHVGETAFRTTTGSIVESGLGFAPKALIAMNNNSDVLGPRSDFIFSVGMGIGSGEESCLVATSDTGSDPTDTASRAYSSQFLADADFNNNVDGLIGIQSMDSDGFTLDQPTKDSTNPVIIPYFAIGPKAETPGNPYFYYLQQQLLAG
jgi:hypothetical protein